MRQTSMLAHPFDDSDDTDTRGPLVTDTFDFGPIAELEVRETRQPISPDIRRYYCNTP